MKGVYSVTFEMTHELYSVRIDYLISGGTGGVHMAPKTDPKHY